MCSPNQRLDQDNGDQTDQADVKALFAATQIEDPTERFHRLSLVLEVDRFVSFVAMEMLVSHWDDYGNHTNNFRIYLKPGRYRFQGLVRTRGLVDGGAGLRISGDTRNRRIAGDAPWTPLSHDFVVEEGAGDVELVLELRTYQGGGEVWFDPESLRMKRF